MKIGSSTRCLGSSYCDGSVTDEIISDCNNNVKLKRWVRGSGRIPASWKTLADVVDSMELKVLAEIIRHTMTLGSFSMTEYRL